jgi:hypothetical protein
MLEKSDGLPAGVAKGVGVLQDGPKRIELSLLLLPGASASLIERIRGLTPTGSPRRHFGFPKSAHAHLG